MRFKFIVKLVVVLVLTGLLLFRVFDSPKLNLEDATIKANNQTSAIPLNSVLLTDVKQFSDEEFKLAFDNLSLPNIKPILAAPIITGNDNADLRILTIAESRGYKLRFIANGLLNQIDDMPVQELLIQSWNELKDEASNQGVQIDFVSGYRSVEDQRALFLDRLYSAGANDILIAKGEQDSIIENILKVTAPPGYSRHHSGYTIDLKDPSFQYFADSSAYAWLKKGNFNQAKRFGFVPSYPNNSMNQGPNPEPWEFVWVGKLITYQQ